MLSGGVVVLWRHLLPPAEPLLRKRMLWAWRSMLWGFVLQFAAPARNAYAHTAADQLLCGKFALT
jgi:hypothetical protein